MRLSRPRRHRTVAAPVPPVAPPPAAAEPAPAVPAVDPERAAARRLRFAGGPEDQATYTCRCGAVFPATPTTSVSCPLCGVLQAW